MLKILFLMCGVLFSVISYAQTLKIFRCEVPGTGHISNVLSFQRNYDYRRSDGKILLQLRNYRAPRIENLLSNIHDTTVEADIANKILSNISTQMDFSIGGASFLGDYSCLFALNRCTPSGITIDTGLGATFDTRGFNILPPRDSSSLGSFKEYIINPEFTVGVDDLYEFSDIEVSMTLLSGYFNILTRNIAGDYETDTLSQNSTVVCRSAGTRFTFSINPDVVDFGNVSAGQAGTVSRNVSFSVTSGTSVPNGTIKFESASTNGYDLPLGTGKLNIFNNTGTRLQFNTNYPVNSRNEDFTAVLYPADVTNFGLSETSVTVVLTIN